MKFVRCREGKNINQLPRRNCTCTRTEEVGRRCNIGVVKVSQYAEYSIRYIHTV